MTPVIDDDEAVTQRAFITDIGLISWSRASAAAQALVEAKATPDQLRVLSALFCRAIPPKRIERTDAGAFDGVRAAQLVQRLKDGPTPADCDALWALLFALFNPRRK